MKTPQQKHDAGLATMASPDVQVTISRIRAQEAVNALDRIEMLLAVGRLAAIGLQHVGRLTDDEIGDSRYAMADLIADARSTYWAALNDLKSNLITALRDDNVTSGGAR